MDTQVGKKFQQIQDFYELALHLTKLASQTIKKSIMFQFS